jgi:hypothetical protein
MLSVLSDFVSRCKKNIEESLKYIRGTREFSFMMEEDADGVGPGQGLSWFEKIIDTHDETLKKDINGRSSNVIEVQEAYVLERDANYAYSERKRLFQIGLDSRLATNYHGGTLATIEKKIEERTG